MAVVTPFPEEPDHVTGGVAGVARTLVAGLAESGECRVTVVAPDQASRRSSEWRGCRVEALPRAPGPGFLSYWTVQRRRIQALLDEVDPDLVHVQGIGGWGLGIGRPWVLTLHGIVERDVLFSPGPLPGARSWLVERVERRARREANAVISISPYLGEHFAASLPADAVPIENPVAASFFEIERRPEPGRVLFVGWIGPRKNVLGLIEGFARCHHPKAQLTIAGGVDHPAYARACRKRVEDLGLSDRVEFTGPLPVAGVTELLARAGCLVLPSFQETAPLVVGEAMAAGVPVVAGRRFGIPHMVREGESGLLFEPESADELGAALDTVLGDAGLASRLSDNARREAHARFEPGAVTEETLVVYRRAAGEDRRRKSP